MSVLIRRSGTLIDLSPDGQAPLDPQLVQLLTPHLSYEHRTLLRGPERYLPDGGSRNIDIETKRMFSIEQGRLVTGFGFITTICEQLRAVGIEPQYVDISPPRQRPDCYESDWERVHEIFDFRPRQEECLDLINRNQCGLINAATGFGKTFLFSSIGHLYPKAKIDIVIKRKDIVAAVVRSLSATLPNVGKVGGGGRSWKGDRITVYTAGSIHKADGDADFLLGDEAHELMSPVICDKIARIYRYTRNFGFTATPTGRMDGACAQLELFFGRQIFELTYRQAVALGLITPVKVLWLDIQMNENPCEGLVEVPKYRWGIWRNDARNWAIANHARTNFGDPNIQVMILVNTFDHAVHLSKFLPEYALCYAKDDPDEIERYKRTNLLPQGFRPVTPSVREELRQNFERGILKKVIATDVWSTGVDFEQLQVIYRADARESEIIATQAGGRPARLCDGKEFAYVVDCYDVFDAGFKRKSEERRRHYAKIGYEQDLPQGRRRATNA